MLKTLISSLTKDSDLPQRAFDIMVLAKVLRGEIYYNLQYDFSQEYTESE